MFDKNNKYSIILIGELKMIEMIGNFSYNYEKDWYEDSNNFALDVSYDDTGYYISSFYILNKNDVFQRRIDAKTYKEAVEKTKKILDSEEYKIWKSKQIWPNPPEVPTAERIEKLVKTSDEAELKYLRNKTDELEERLIIVENSVEDIQKWRHS